MKVIKVPGVLKYKYSYGSKRAPSLEGKECIFGVEFYTISGHKTVTLTPLPVQQTYDEEDTGVFQVDADDPAPFKAGDNVDAGGDIVQLSADAADKVNKFLSGEDGYITYTEEQAE